MSNNARFNQLRIPAGLTMAGLSLAGLVACGGKGSSSPNYSPTTSKASASAGQESPAASIAPTPKKSTDSLVSSLVLDLDFSKLEKNGTCQDGRPRPCFEPVRTKPAYTDSTDFLNKIGSLNGEACAEWPYEGHGAYRPLCQDGLTKAIIQRGNGNGDPLTVVCQVRGATVTSPGRADNDPKRASSVWDVVRVVPENMSPAALDRASAAHPAFGIEKGLTGNIGSVTAAFGFVPDMWLGNHGVYNQLPPCTPAQNPAHYPNAR
jgi:hypothetical protein